MAAILRPKSSSRWNYHLISLICFDIKCVVDVIKIINNINSDNKNHLQQLHSQFLIIYAQISWKLKQVKSSGKKN